MTSGKGDDGACSVNRDVRSLQQTNLDMLDSQLATDVTFRLCSPDGRTVSDVRAHRGVLLSRSEVFHAMFTSGMAETRDDVINIEDIDPETFRIVLSYIYAAETEDITPDNVLRVLYAARKYILSGLVAKCEQAFVSSLTVDNACTVLEHAEHFSLPELESDCLSFLGEHTQAFIKTDAFFQLSADTLEKIVKQDRLEFSDEGEVYEACVTWARRQLRQSTQLDNPTDQQIRQQLADVIYRIRFPTMRHGEFARLVCEESNILTAEEQRDILVVAGRDRATGIKFDSNPRRFSNPRVLRFDTSKQYLAVCPLKTFINFRSSINVTLTAVGLYGVESKRQLLAAATHALTVTVKDGNRTLGELSTDMTSDGSDDPIRIALPTPVAIEADKTYTVCATMNGPDTHWGCAGNADVTFYGSETIRFLEVPAPGAGALSVVAEGQLPALYFHVPPQ